MCTLKNSLDKSFKHHRNSYARSYQLLKNYNHNKNSRLLFLKEEVSINGIQGKKDIFNEENYSSVKKKQSNGDLSKITRNHKPIMKNRSSIFETKKYSHLEKKIFKEINYTDFLKNNRTISNKVYKKTICKKYGLRIFLPVLIFMFLLIIFIIEVSLGFSGKHSLMYQLGLDKNYLQSLSSDSTWSSIVEVLEKLGGFLKHTTSETASVAKCVWCETGKEVTKYCILGHFFSILIYFVPFIILSITVISGIIYYHKKVKKYEKIKFRKRKNI
ncbi:Plasmodium exported protein (Pm-fam-a like), unknown function [Plasmodium malariae]|uniref:Fam-l protein n=1 Tax=Plasmodium malariae TaxID=5858 RepID=A0A1A8X5K1_PLAMA|nr:Plasmodium exported protein (Pm-fam-a like), unknown function [Plasmodium malariae]